MRNYKMWVVAILIGFCVSKDNVSPRLINCAKNTIEYVNYKNR